MNAEQVLGSRKPGDKSDLGGYVRALAEAGLHVVLVEPNGKAPLDMRSYAAKRADDEVAQATAKAAGNPLWANVRAQAGVHLATADTGRLDAYVSAAAKRYGVDTVNLGVEVGRSRLVIVDADNGADVEAFQAAHAAEAGETITPTVDTPGKRDASGTWVHKDGGHFWFTVPEGVELPEGTGAYTVDGWTAYYADRQLLIAPSERPEGPYTWRGGIRPLPTWLHARITTQADVRTAKAAERMATMGDSPIDTWAAATPWADILEPRGWVDSGRVSNCGCPEWTAPGPHDSPKSATAHDLGCTDDRYDGSAGHAPLHVWTDNPPEGIAAYTRKHGTRTMSKLQYVAWTDHAGEQGEAAQALGIPENVETVEPGEPLDVPVEPSPTKADIVAMSGQSGAGSTREQDRLDAGFITRSDLKDIPALEPLVDGFLYRDTVAQLVGEPGSYKSFLALDWAASVVTGRNWNGKAVSQGEVLYFVGEGLSGIDDRVAAWETTHLDGAEAGVGLFKEIVDLAAVPTETAGWVHVAWRIAHRDTMPSLIVVDTQARFTPGVEENAAKEMGQFLTNMDTLRRLTGACVLLLHHVARGSKHGRGSTAIEGGMQSVFIMDKGANGKATLETTKQKDGPEHADVTFHAVQVKGTGSIVLESAALDGDPFNEPDLPRVNPKSPNYERLAAALFRTFNHGTSGATKAEAKTALQGDPELKIVADNERNVGRRFSEAWSTLEERGHLERIGGKDKYKITEAYAADLGLIREDETP